jgi:hypothetical protein
MLSFFVHRTFFKEATLLTLFSMLLISLPGCGSSGKNKIGRVSVSGDVTVEGTPLKEGTIRFVPTEETSGPSAAASIKEGHYSIPVRTGPVSGKYVVQITAAPDREIAALMEDPVAMAAYLKKNRGRPKATALPEKYNRKSMLIVDVQPGEANDFDFHLDRKMPVATNRR